MVGFTCTGQSFNIAFSFMGAEVQDHYEWVFLQLGKVFKLIGKRPKVILTDRDLAELNTIGVQFPDAQHMLCWVYIQRNCIAHALGKGFSQGSAANFGNSTWGLFCSTTVEEYNLRKELLKQ
jgi:hypothetical protein